MAGFGSPMEVFPSSLPGPAHPASRPGHPATPLREGTPSAVLVNVCLMRTRERALACRAVCTAAPLPGTVGQDARWRRERAGAPRGGLSPAREQLPPSPLCSLV